MLYEWDEDKNRQNIAKHDVDFDAVENFDWQTALIARDERRDYGEPRFAGYGFIAGKLHICVYTQREDRRRANTREERFYEKTIKTIH